MRLKPGRRDPSFDVFQGLVDLQRQSLVTEQLARAVIEALRGDSKSLFTGNFAPLVDHPGQVLQYQWARRVDQASGVVQVPVIQIQGQALVRRPLC
ncbi:hypothetical protein D3C79_872600 [compost metagenome]